MAQQYTRQQFLGSAQISSSHLAYLESRGVVSPERVGNNPRPVVFFSGDDLAKVLLYEKCKSVLTKRQMDLLVGLLKTAGVREDMCIAIVQGCGVAFYFHTGWEDLGPKLKELSESSLFNEKLIVIDVGGLKE